MTRLEDLIFDTLANGLLKSLVVKAPKRLIRAVWTSVRRSCPAPAVVI
jgi:hypothetical protein